jgi:hypothetical protein
VKPLEVRGGIAELDRWVERDLESFLYIGEVRGRWELGENWVWWCGFGLGWTDLSKNNWGIFLVQIGIVFYKKPTALLF